VVCKAPYRNTNDSRVARRLADDQWAWYHRTALRTVIQACGRVVRAPDDYGATYLADDSLLDLFDRARADTPPWFRDQIDAMTTPDLPEFDPAAALAGVAADPSGPARAGRQRVGGGDDAGGASARNGSAAEGSGGAAAGGSDAADTGGSANGSGRGGDAGGTRTRSEADAERREDHPPSDVWGDG
jgi:hypothetical protein